MKYDLNHYIKYVFNVVFVIKLIVYHIFCLNLAIAIHARFLEIIDR